MPAFPWGGCSPLSACAGDEQGWLPTRPDAQPLGQLGRGVAAGGVELGLGQADGAAHLGPREVGARELGALEVRALQIGPDEGGVGQVGGFVFGSVFSPSPCSVGRREDAVFVLSPIGVDVAGGPRRRSWCGSSPRPRGRPGAAARPAKLLDFSSLLARSAWNRLQPGQLARRPGPWRSGRRSEPRPARPAIRASSRGRGVSWLLSLTPRV